MYSGSEAVKIIAKAEGIRKEPLADHSCKHDVLATKGTQLRLKYA